MATPPPTTPPTGVRARTTPTSPGATSCASTSRKGPAEQLLLDRAAGPAAERRDVVVGGVGRLGRLGQDPDVGRRGEAALVGVEHVDPDRELTGHRRDPDPGLAVEPEVDALPLVERRLVLAVDVVDRHEDLVEGVLDDGGQGAVPA